MQVEAEIAQCLHRLDCIRPQALRDGECRNAVAVAEIDVRNPLSVRPRESGGPEARIRSPSLGFLGPRFRGDERSVLLSRRNTAESCAPQFHLHAIDESAHALPWLSIPVALFIGGIGAVSVFKAVYIDKRDIKCACVGGSSKVPLGFVSLTENVMMIAMALWMARMWF